MNTQNLNLNNDFMHAQKVINSALKNVSEVKTDLNAVKNTIFSDNHIHINLDKTDKEIDALDLMSTRIYPKKNNKKIEENYKLAKKHFKNTSATLYEYFKLLIVHLFEKTAVTLVKMDKFCEEKFKAFTKHIEDIKERERSEKLILQYQQEINTEEKVEKVTHLLLNLKKSETFEIPIRFYKVRVREEIFTKEQNNVDEIHQENALKKALILVYKELRYGNTLRTY